MRWIAGRETPRRQTAQIETLPCPRGTACADKTRFADGCGAPRRALCDALH